MSLSLVAGLGQLQAAQAVPAALDAEPAGLADVLLGSYILVTDKQSAEHLVVSADLLDWQARNPQADPDAIREHAAATEDKIDAKVADYLWQRNAAEAVGAAIEAIGPASAAAPIGPKVRELIFSIVGTSNVSRSGKASDRVSGAQQQIAWNSDFAKAQSSVWAGVAQQARANASFRGGWNAAIGATLGVDAATTGAILAATPQLRGTLDFGAIFAAQGSPSYPLVINEQLTKLTDKLKADRDKDFATFGKALDDRPPGAAWTEPDAKQREEAKKASEERLARMNDAKAGMDGLAFLAGLVSPDLGRQIRLFGDGAMQIAQAVDKVITAAQLVNTAFSLAAVGLTGNFIGAISTLVTLFAGAGETVDQQILKAIAALQKQIADLRVHLDRQFDRIDRKLDDQFVAMLGEFQKLGEDVQEVKDQAGTIAVNLANVENQLQVLGVTLLKAIQSLAKGPLWTTTDALIDYSFYHRDRLLTQEMYDQGEASFFSTARTTSAEDAFVVPEEAYTDVSAKVGPVLEQYGPYGSISFLGAYAHKALDSTYPQPGKVGNAAVWELAANGYSLLSSQNPTLAKEVSEIRAGQVITAGREIRDTAQSFSAPGPDGSTNKIFGSLTTKYRDEFVKLMNTVQDREQFVKDGKTYKLFGGLNQTIPSNGLESPLQAPQCDGSLGPLDTPTNVSGKLLPTAEMFARYIGLNNQNWAGPAYDVCWRATWENKHSEYDYTGPFQIRADFGDLAVVFEEGLTWPEKPRGVARTTSKIVTKDYQYQGCSRASPDVPFYCGDDPPITPPQKLVADWDGSAKANFQTDAESNSPVAPAEDATNRMTQFLTNKRIEHYQKAAAFLRQNPSTTSELNLLVSLHRAYTQLGFPRALEGDDNLRALLFGDHAIYNDTPDEYNAIAGMIDAAAVNLADNKPPEQQDQMEGTDKCQRLDGLTGDDPFIACLAWSSAVRLNRLAGRYAEHFKARSEGIDETLPLVQTAMRNLRLVTDAVNPGTVPGPPADDLPAQAPALASWSTAGPAIPAAGVVNGPATTTYKGLQFALWRGADSGLYLSSSTDGSSWKPAEHILASNTTSAAPALTVHDGKLFASWTGAEDSQVYTSSSADGSSWSAPTRVTPQGVRSAAAQGSSAGPALASVGGKLHAVWKGAGDDSAMYAASSVDGVTWSAPVAAGTDGHTSAGPATTALGDKLVLAWTSTDGAVVRSSTSKDGIAWTAPVGVAADSKSGTGPALTVADGAAYIAWRGVGDDTAMYLSSSTDGSSWAARVQAGRDARTSTTPAVGAFNGRLWLTWATGADNLWSAYATRLPIAKQPTAVALGTGIRIANGEPAQLTAVLSSQGPIAGRPVTLSLGAGATQQSCYGTTDLTGTARCTIAKVDQQLTDAASTRFAASFFGDRGYQGSDAAGSVSLEFMAGRAFGLSAGIHLPLVRLDLLATPDTGQVRTTGAGIKEPPCTARVDTLVITASAVCAKVTTSTSPSVSKAATTVSEVRIGIPGIDVLEISGLTATSTSTCTSATGSASLTLKVAGKSVPISGDPNSAIDLGAGARLVVNEQKPVAGADRGLTVNAVHLTALVGTVDVVVGSSTSSLHNCASR
ncbi:choice-of-anchor P family protein [Streptomyces sp. SID13031]|uniref:choice-of-anchor P family protein n=1 Tax=Streptomyces sp. SID13031 TaxID=2706046 RepID=UPI0013CD7AA6|nr:choice-of-anchor P family protein [Streptomyces sp. SID13031]NEA35593.1 hypothetical protein [Streptomyces sp. SID13031]